MKGLKTWTLLVIALCAELVIAASLAAIWSLGPLRSGEGEIGIPNRSEEIAPENPKPLNEIAPAESDSVDENRPAESEPEPQPMTRDQIRRTA